MHRQRTQPPHRPYPIVAPGPLPAGPGQELLAAFDGYLGRHGRTPGTRDRYGRVLARYCAWLDGHSPATVMAEEIDRYLQQWQHEFAQSYGRPPALASYRGQINALRSFYDYLDRFSLLADPDGRALPDPMRRIPCPTAPQAANDWLRPSEDQALQACPGSLAERFPIMLLRWSGIRVGEACALTLADLDLTPEHETLTIRSSKTRAGQRTIPIVPELTPLLNDWLTQLNKRGLESPSTPLLATRNETPMCESFVWRLVKRLGHRAGVRPIPCVCHTSRPPHEPGCPRTRNGHNLSQLSPHTLRRTFASDLLNRGLRLEIVSKLLGHASTTVTERAYAHLLDHTTRRELLHALNHTA
jgi:integrase